MPVDFKPSGYHTVTPYLVVNGAVSVIRFAETVLEGTCGEKLAMPDGRIGHAEIHVDDSVIMVADAPQPGREMPAMLHVYVEDTDATYRRAIDAGATSEREPKDEFYGDRMSGVRDACGNVWYFATHIEDVSPEEMLRRATEVATAG